MQSAIKTIVLALLAMSSEGTVIERPLRPSAQVNDSIPSIFRRVTQLVPPLPGVQSVYVYTTVTTFIHCISTTSDPPPAGLQTIPSRTGTFSHGAITATVEGKPILVALTRNTAAVNTAVSPSLLVTATQRSTSPVQRSSIELIADPPSTLLSSVLRQTLVTDSSSPTPLIPATSISSAPPPPTALPSTQALSPSTASPPSPALPPSANSFPSPLDTTSRHAGELTYYDPGLGACGVTSFSNDKIVAISHLLFDPATPGANPNLNPLCNRKIEISRAAGFGGVGAEPSTGQEKTIVVSVVDRCTGCAVTDLDVPRAVHSFLVSNSAEAGRVTDMSWRWV